MMVSAKKNIPTPPRHLAVLPPRSWRRGNGDLLFDGTGVRVCCQSQGFAWQRQGTLRGNGPAPGGTGENIWRCAWPWLQLAAIIGGHHDIADRFVAKAIVDPHEKELPGVGLDVKLDMRHCAGGQLGKDWHGQSEHDIAGRRP